MQLLCNHSFAFSFERIIRKRMGYFRLETAANQLTTITNIHIEMIYPISFVFFQIRCLFVFFFLSVNMQKVQF